MIVDSAALAAGVWGVVGDLIPAGQRMVAAREIVSLFEKFGGEPLRSAAQLCADAGVVYTEAGVKIIDKLDPQATSTQGPQTIAHR